MFKKSLVLFIGLLFLFGVFLGGRGIFTAEAAGEWTFVAESLNQNMIYDATYPVLAVYKNEIYAAWEERSATVPHIMVRKFDGTHWTFVVGYDGINKHNTDYAEHPSLAACNGFLYAAWEEFNGTYTAIRVKRYNGLSWTEVDDLALQGLNRVEDSASNPMLTVFNGELFLAWEQMTNGVRYIHVKKYTNGTTWEFVDGNTDMGLNRAAYNASFPSMTVCNDQLYIGWVEENPSGIPQVRIRRYDGNSTWTLIDGDLTDGLNYLAAKPAGKPWLAAINNNLYVTWDEPKETDSLQIDIPLVRVKRYDGNNNWTFIDNGCLNWNTNLPARTPKITVWDSKAYITWWEEDLDSFVPQIRVKEYDGFNYSFIDGGQSTSQVNLNYSRLAENPFPLAFNADLYVAWSEDVSGTKQIIVKKYPLPPVVTSVTIQADGTYISGKNLYFTVNFNREITVSGGSVTLPVTFDTGGTVDAVLNTVGASNTTSLSFRCPVDTGFSDNDGVTLGPSLKLTDGCTIRDTYGFDADLELNNIPSTAGMIIDAVLPAISSVSPANWSKDVPLGSNLVINFSKSIVKGTGNIRIMQEYANMDDIAETFDVSGSNVTVDGNSVTINPTFPLHGNSKYYVIMDRTAFQDLVGNYFPGINDRNVWRFETEDNEAPNFYSVKIDQPWIDNTNNTALSFTFADAELETTYHYTLTSSGGGTPVTGEGTIGSGTQQISRVDTSSLNDGTLTLSVTLTDAAGNMGKPATATVKKDTQMSGYTVDFSQNYVNSGNQNAISFTITGGEPESSYEYTITSSGGGTTIVKGNGSYSGIAKTVTGVNVTGLKDGTLTLSLTMTDAVGNTGKAATDTVIKDLVPPSGYSFSIKQTLIDHTNQKDLHIVFSGAEAGDTYQYNLSSSVTGAAPINGTGTLTGPNEEVGGIDVSSLKDGTLTLRLALTDSAGNPGPTLTRTVKKDAEAPIVALSDNDADNIVKVGAKVTLTAVFNQVMAAAPTISITNGGVTDVKMTDSGDHKVWRYIWTVPAGDTTATVSVKGHDPVGNPYNGTDTLTFTIDSTAPIITGVAYQYSSSGSQLMVTLSESCKNLAKANNGGFSVTEKGGTTVYAVTTTKISDDRHVVLTVPKLDYAGSKGVTLRYTANTYGTIQDIAGNPLSTNSVGFDVDSWDNHAPCLHYVERGPGTNTGINVFLSEDCRPYYKTNNGGFTVTETGTGKTYPVTEVSGFGSWFTLTVANMRKSANKGVTVTYTAGGNGTIQDIAGNPLPTDTKGKTVQPWDIWGPSFVSGAILSTAPNNAYLDVKFNEPAYGDANAKTAITVDDLALVFSANGGTATNTTIKAVRKNDGSTPATASPITAGDTEIRVFLNITGTPSGVETFVITPANDACIFDSIGNASSVTNATDTYWLHDKIRPSLVGAERTNNTHITVTLSEDCDNLDKANNGGFTVVETGNPKKVYAVTKTARGADYSHIVLTVANMGASGKEGVKVKYTAGTYGTIKDDLGNTLVTNTTGVAVAPWDLEAPTLVDASRKDDTHLIVTLSENCINLVKTNNGGFTVTENGTGTNYPVTAIAKGADAAHVILTVANIGVSAKEGVTVKYATGTNGTVQDVAGNAMVTDDTGVSVAAWDTAGPAILNSTIAAGNNYIDITFNEGVFGADNGTTGLNASDFALTFAASDGTATNAEISSVKKTNSTTEGTAAALTGGETAVRVFLSVTGTPSGAETIEIKPANDASIYDKAGNAALASVTTAAKRLRDKLRPTLADAIRVDNTHISVFLSEECKNTTKANNGGFTVRENGGTKAYAVTKVAKGDDASVVILTVANMSASGGKGVTVRYTAGTYGTIQDTAGNPMAGNSTGIKIPLWNGYVGNANDCSVYISNNEANTYNMSFVKVYKVTGSQYVPIAAECQVDPANGSIDNSYELPMFAPNKVGKFNITATVEGHTLIIPVYVYPAVGLAMNSDIGSATGFIFSTQTWTDDSNLADVYINPTTGYLYFPAGGRRIPGVVNGLSEFTTAPESGYDLTVIEANQVHGYYYVKTRAGGYIKLRIGFTQRDPGGMIGMVLEFMSASNGLTFDY